MKLYLEILNILCFLFEILYSWLQHALQNVSLLFTSVYRYIFYPFFDASLECHQPLLGISRTLPFFSFTVVAVVSLSVPNVRQCVSFCQNLDIQAKCVCVRLAIRSWPWGEASVPWFFGISIAMLHAYVVSIFWWLWYFYFRSEHMPNLNNVRFTLFYAISIFLLSLIYSGFVYPATGFSFPYFIFLRLYVLLLYFIE